MTGEQMRAMRNALGLTKVQFAIHVIGYTGSDRNVDNRIHRLEREAQIPLHLARLLYLFWQEYRMTGEMPHWPDSLRLEGEMPPWMSQN